MLRPYARPHAAQMIEMLACRNRADHLFIHPAMGPQPQRQSDMEKAYQLTVIRAAAR